MSEAEEQLGIRITEAYAGISGDFVRCARHTDHVFVYDPQNGVNQKDVDALFDRMRNVQAPDDETIMERVPQNYVVDDNQEVKNPVGSFGKKLSSTFNFILCLKTPMQRLDMALKRVGIKMLSVTSNAIATAEAVLLPDEKEEGVAVVDIGGGVTDVAVYYRNVVRYIATIPMGATAINRDIRTMSVPEKHVESLKQKYGSAVADLAPEDKLIRVNGRRVTGMDVRVASAETGIAEESKEKAADPAYATAVGILLKGAEQGACAFVERPVARPAEQQGFRPPQPQPAPEFRHTPRFQQPVQAPPAAPAAEEAEEDAAAEREEAPVIEPKRKRDWGSIFQKTFDKINKSFTAAEDEEI